MRSFRKALTVALVVGALQAAAFAQPDSACSSFSFAEAAGELGVVFEHKTGATGDKHLRETMGAGVAWLDYDEDGWWDLFLVQSESQDGTSGALLRNSSGRGFESASAPLAAPSEGYGQGVLAADLNGDTYVDLLVTRLGTDLLYLNSGNGRFATATEPFPSDAWSSSAAAADADGDGDLDLYITRYLDYEAGPDIFCGDPAKGERDYCDPSLFAGASDGYFEAVEAGRFVERTADAGLLGASGRGLGVVFADLDGDRDADLYVANDLTLNFLFEGSGTGRFSDLSLISGSAVNGDGRPEAGMGIALGDIDGDLDGDLAVTNFDVETNTLYRNHGELAFEDVSKPTGFGLPSFNLLAFGIVTGDFDLDGDLDFYVANGHIFERPARENVSHRQPDQLFSGDGQGNFEKVECQVLDSHPTVARGLAAGDLDNDGDLDLAVQENGGPARLLRNQRNGSHWLGLRLRGRKPNSDAVGARVVLGSGDERQVRWVTAGDSYQSTSDRRVHFGLGGAEARSVEVIWPDGRRQRVLDLPTARYLVFDEAVEP